MLESKFQSNLRQELEEVFPGCIVLKNDTEFNQGFPDLLVLYENNWAALECKKSASEPYQPNQEYYLDLLNSMSYANVIFPENKEEVIDELQHAFASRRATRLSKRK